MRFISVSKLNFVALVPLNTIKGSIGRSAIEVVPVYPLEIAYIK